MWCCTNDVVFLVAATAAVVNSPERGYYVAAKATYIRLLLGQNGVFPALAP